MRNRCRLRSEPDDQSWFLCYFKMVTRRALVFLPPVKGKEALGTRLRRNRRIQPAPMFLDFLLWYKKNRTMKPSHSRICIGIQFDFNLLQRRPDKESSFDWLSLMPLRNTYPFDYWNHCLYKCIWAHQLSETKAGTTMTEKKNCKGKISNSALKGPSKTEIQISTCW